MNKKGFTLIELLAVITIMGILMLVSIPAVSRTIENTRRSTYANIAKTYINEIKTAVAADELLLESTGENISAVGSGYYYYGFKSADTTGQDLVEQGGKSSWGNIDVQGYILIKKDVGANGKTKYEYAIRMVDIGNTRRGVCNPTIETNLTRSSVTTNVSGSNCLPRDYPDGQTSDTNPWKSGQVTKNAATGQNVQCLKLKLAN